MASVLQVATIKDQGGNANAIEIANSSANVTINNLTSSTGFPSGMVLGYEKNQTTISSAQVLTTTYQDVTGSSLTYTPATGSSYIVYECSFVIGSPSAAPLLAFKFLVDGSITKAQDSSTPYFAGNGAEISTVKSVHRMIYSASGWTSDKVVKMQARQYQAGTSTHHAILHKSFYNYAASDGSGMGSAGSYYTDVDVTIYSVK